MVGGWASGGLPEDGNGNGRFPHAHHRTAHKLNGRAKLGNRRAGEQGVGIGGKCLENSLAGQRADDSLGRLTGREKRL